MINKEKLNYSSTDELLKNVLFITLIAIIFFILAAKFGGYASDAITRSSCNAIDETYIEGQTPGSGICVKSTSTTNLKK